MNNNAWLGRFPVDLCLLSSPSFVKLSITMAAHTELFFFSSYLFLLCLPRGLIPCGFVFSFSEFEHYAVFTR